jgi:hypothetical protein
MAKGFAAADLAVGRIVKYNGALAFVSCTDPTDLAVGIMRESVTTGFEASTFDEQNPEGQVIAGQAFLAADVGKSFVSDSTGRAVLLEDQDPGDYRVVGFIAGIGSTNGLVRCIFNRGEVTLPAES